MRQDYEKMVQCIEEMVDVLNDLKVEWWLEHGSCLGLVRDGKFLEDYDLDIGIKTTRKDGAVLSEMTKRYQLYAAYWRTVTGRIRYIRIDRHARIDLLYYYRDAESYYSIRKEEEKDYMIKRVPHKHIDEVETREYRGKKYNVPKDPEDYLRYVYGEDWNIPNPQGRSIYKMEKLKK